MLDKVKVRNSAAQLFMDEEKVTAIISAYALETRRFIDGIARKTEGAVPVDINERTKHMMGQVTVRIMEGFDVTVHDITTIMQAFSQEELKAASHEAHDADCPYCQNPHVSARPATHEVLNSDLKCGNPECSCRTVEMMPECHPESGSRVFYCRIHGIIAVYCNGCRRLQSAILVGSAGSQKTSRGKNRRGWDKT
jgi:hypothetical protein